MYSESFTLTAVKLVQLGVRCNFVLEISNACTIFDLFFDPEVKQIQLKHVY